MSNRRRLLAKVHVAKKQLGLDDDTYRDVLERVTGKRTGAELDDNELVRVLDAFKANGWKSTGAAGPSGKPHVRKVWALWGQMLRDGVATGGRVALRHFVQRMTSVADPEWLTADQASSVIEALKAWRKRELAKRRGSTK